MDGPESPGVGRRGFLGYVGSAAAGAAAGTAAGAAWSRSPDETTPTTPVARGDISPYGAHQPGVAAPTPAVVEVVALDLHPDIDREGLGRLLRVWTGDIEALAAGRPSPGDTEPWLAAAAAGAGLTVSVGLGPGALATGGIDPPQGFTTVPPMRHDRLEERWSGGDLGLVVGASEGTTVAHAVRQLVRDARPFARQRYRQTGSWNGVGPDGRPVTGRNLFGQLDGTGNPVPGSDTFERTVWIGEPAWEGATTLVVRRIAMDLDLWATLTGDEQEGAVGRALSDGARLPRMGTDAHARLAHPSANAGARIFRKGSNYVSERETPEGPTTESGLVFMSFQASVADQFVPVQRGLDRSDALNKWTTAVGSAAFVVLPGFARGDWLGSGVVG